MQFGRHREEENSQRKRLRQSDRRNPELSNRESGRRLGVNYEMVRQVRVKPDLTPGLILFSDACFLLPQPIFDSAH